MYAEERQQAIAQLVNRARPGVGEPAGRAVRRHDRDGPPRPVDARAAGSGPPRARRGGPAGVAVPHRVRPRASATRSTPRPRSGSPRAALDRLPPAGGTILLDAGSTTSRLASLLPPDHELTVITHAVPIAARLAGQRQIDLRLLPGRVRRTTQAAVGADTVAALGELRVDVAFLGTNGVTAEHGLTTPDPDEAAVKRALIASGRRVVALADASKFGIETAVRFAAPGEIDVLITDATSRPPTGGRSPRPASRWRRTPRSVPCGPHDRHPHRQPQPRPHGQPRRPRSSAARSSAPTR